MAEKEKQLRHIDRKERGSALIIILLVLPVLIGAAGLALDWGRGVWTKTQLQKASDAGALGGVGFLPDEALARQYATEMVVANFNDPDGAVYTPLGDQYKVELSETIPTYFMRLFGHHTMQIGADSTAIANKPVGGLRGGSFPFAILNPDFNGDSCDDLVPSNYGKRYIIFYGEDNVMVGDWVNGCDPVPGVPQGNARGWRGALKLGQDGSLGGAAGADDLRYCMQNGWPGVMRVGDVIPVQTGNIDNPVNQGRNALLGQNPLPWEDFDPHLHKDDPRVVMVPIIHLIHATRLDTYTAQDWINGAEWVHDFVVVDGFAPFFILTVSEQGDVDGDGNPNDRDWVTGYFIPGTQTGNFLPPDDDTPDYGLLTPPRLVD